MLVQNLSSLLHALFHLELNHPVGTQHTQHALFDRNPGICVEMQRELTRIPGEAIPRQSQGGGKKEEIKSVKAQIAHK